LIIIMNLCLFDIVKFLNKLSSESWFLGYLFHRSYDFAQMEIVRIFLLSVFIQGFVQRNSLGRHWSLVQSRLMLGRLEPLFLSIHPKYLISHIQVPSVNLKAGHINDDPLKERVESHLTFIHELNFSRSGNCLSEALGSMLKGGKFSFLVG